MEQFEQQLQAFWLQGGRELALSFLRRAVTPNISLRELLATLQFPQVQEHLGDIRLADVLPRREAPARAAEPAGGRHVQAPVAAKGRRQRRSKAATERCKERLQFFLRQEPGSLNTSQLVEALAQEGQPLDTTQVGGLLKALVAEGLVQDLGGKPKRWRATAKLAGAPA